jgi:hypothetical protein
LAVIAIIMDEEEQREMRKRKWLHEAWVNRQRNGEFGTLYKELNDDEMKFSEYFKMSENCFNIVLSKMEVRLTTRTPAGTVSSLFEVSK